jgi:UDP-N-acetylglucosamine 2-epimerase (non-hydrolysing)
VKVANVVGARPNFMKMAPIMRLMKGDPFFEPCLIHTGQHYDEQLSEVFLSELGLPEPDTNLYAGSGSHGKQTGEVMIRFEEVVTASRPDLVLTVGDVNSTLAVALVAAKLHIPVAHVEAGLRSFDRSMPEEINRVLTDAISDFLFVTERSAAKNLMLEGVAAAKVFFVGNVMIDTLLSSREKAAKSDIVEKQRLTEGNYAVVTLHRPSNVDDREALERIVSALREISAGIQVVFPAHPRTFKNLSSMGMLESIEAGGRVRILPPLGYLDFLRLVDCSRFVLTDSGGLQEETTVLGIPCVTLRENTERPVTIEQGTSTLVGNDRDKILAAAQAALVGGRRTARIPELWDGRAAERIVSTLKESFS